MTLDLIDQLRGVGAGWFTADWARATLLFSVIAAGMLATVCGYLAVSTRKAHFRCWLAGWMWFVGYLVVSFVHMETTRPVLAVAQFGCLGLSGMFLLLGVFTLLERTIHPLTVPLLGVAVVGWSLYGTWELGEAWWNHAPLLALQAGAAVWTGAHYGHDRPRSRANRLLTVGWFSVGFGLLGWAGVGLAPAGNLVSQAFLAVALAVVALALMLKEEATLAEDKYRGVLETNPDALFIVDLWTQQVLDANKAATRLTKWPLDQLLKRDFVELCPQLRKNGTTLLELRGMFHTVFRPHSEFHIVRADHTPVVCEGDASLVQWRNRAVIQLTAREVDQTAQVNQLVRRTEKLSSLGQLVAGVAHELNNPLAVVMGYAQVLVRQPDLDTKHRDPIERILHESERAAKIVRDLLSFARPCEPQLTTVDLNHLIGNVLDIRETELRGQAIQDQVYLAPDLPPTKADPIQIEQVINNLVSNSLHALAARPPGERRLKITSEVRGFFLQVTVTDSGPGIPPAIRERIFDPFFTTKPPGKGTGLGLSISNTIMQEHHGRIWCESELGRWTEFHLELPVVPVDERPAPARPASAPAVPATDAVDIAGAFAPPAVGERRLLVVDDEPGIREVLKDVLSCCGYLVDTAGNGDEAMRQIAAARYDLVISDLCMPEMDGPALYRAVLDKNAPLARRIIFVTGDTVSPKSREFLEETRNRWLSKPFNIRDVEDTVKDVLGRPEPVGR